MLSLAETERGRTIMRNFERVVERLGDVREVGAKGEFRDDMREIHDCKTSARHPNLGERTRTRVINMLSALVSMSEGRNVQIC